MTIRRFFGLLLLGGLTGLWACAGSGSLGISPVRSEREQYELALRAVQLHQTALGTDWLAAGQRALRDSFRLTLPYRESGYFSAQRPVATGYLIDTRRGDKLLIHIEVQGKPTGRVFLDLYEPGTREPTLVASTKTDSGQVSTGDLVWTVRQNQAHLLRVQPELLRSGRFTLSVTREPVLGFPVQGRDSRGTATPQISSFFGDPRDGGQRRHEGIDIFASKGTPALASVNGTVTGVGTNALGGNVVWLADDDLNVRLYYAHLDRWAVRPGQRVSVGDTLGFVGNTGNARTTGPHLHFGVYESGSGLNRGAVDPLAFVLRGPGPARQPLPPASQLGDSVRIGIKQGLLRTAPTGDAPIRQKLVKNAALTVLGGTADWLRVALPDGRTGYVAAKSVESIRQPLRRWSLPDARPLHDAADTLSAVMTTLPGGTAVEVLASAGAFTLIHQPGGPTGWIR